MKMTLLHLTLIQDNTIDIQVMYIDWLGVLPLIGVNIYATGKKGGALLSALHAYMQHGDPFVKSLVKHMLNQVRVLLSIILNTYFFGLLVVILMGLLLYYYHCINCHCMC